MPTQPETRPLPVPPGPIWNPEAAANWSLPFSPAFGSFLQMRNWTVLGEPDKARASGVWFIASIVMLAAYPVVYLMFADHPQADLGVRLAGFLFLLTWYLGHARQQAKFVKQQYGTQYPRKKWGAPLGIALACGVAYLGMSFALAVAVAVVKEL
ncbi:MAG: hypothetical protein JNL28_13690 [Planctomycetes bacterium]|nr:hypothetical protein [Planctomycetota bacterium]